MKKFWAEKENGRSLVIGARVYSSKGDASVFCDVMDLQGDPNWTVKQKEHRDVGVKRGDK